MTIETENLMKLLVLKEKERKKNTKRFFERNTLDFLTLSKKKKFINDMGFVAIELGQLLSNGVYVELT